MSRAKPHARAIAEVAGTILTACGFGLYRLVVGGTLWFMVAASAVWLAYVSRAILREPGVLKEWGIRIDNLRPAVRRSVPFFIVPLMCMLAFRLWRGWVTPRWSFWIVLLLYPAWGLAQQFLVQAMVARNLRKLGLPAWGVAAVVGLAFGLVHVGHAELAALCAAAGIVWTALFLKTPNIIPLALAHGWLGALAYCWILDVDPLQEIVLSGG